MPMEADVAEFLHPELRVIDGVVMVDRVLGSRAKARTISRGNSEVLKD